MSQHPKKETPSNRRVGKESTKKQSASPSDTDSTAGDLSTASVTSKSDILTKVIRVIKDTQVIRVRELEDIFRQDPVLDQFYNSADYARKVTNPPSQT